MQACIDEGFSAVVLRHGAGPAPVLNWRVAGARQPGTFPLAAPARAGYSSRMSRTAFVAELGAKVGETELTTVVRPDHPFLVNGPDVLVGGRGKLIALFVPTSSEAGDGEQLMARVGLTRLALPSHATCILVVPRASGDGSAVLPEETALTFHGIVRGEELGSLRAVVEDPPRPDWISDVPVSLRTRHFQRAAQLLQISEQAGMRTREQTGGRSVGIDAFKRIREPYPTWRDRRRASPDVVGVSEAVSAIGPRLTSQRSSTIPGLVPFLVRSVIRNFAPDGGVLYPRVELPSAQMIIVPHSVTSRGDPGKPARASAFAGTLLVENAPEEVVIEAAGRLQRWRIRASKS